jgi:hypothetical protein
MTVAVELPPATATVHRNLHSRYSASVLGSTAIDGSVLDRVSADYAWSSAWLVDPQAGCVCLRGEFWLFVAGRHHFGCKEHPSLRPPKVNPWPMASPERRAAEESRWNRLATRHNIPPRYRDLRLEELMATPVTATPAVQAMSEFLEQDEPKCLTLAGPTGRGKTVSLVVGFRETSCWDADSPLWYPMPTLARALLNPDSSGGTLEACIRADLLAIDDIGATYVKAGGFVEGALEEIFCEREANYAMTLLSTNLPLPAFEEAVGDRIADRLRGQWGQWVSLPGESLRRKRRQVGS